MHKLNNLNEQISFQREITQIKNQSFEFSDEGSVLNDRIQKDSNILNQRKATLPYNNFNPNQRIKYIDIFTFDNKNEGSLENELYLKN